MSRTKCGMCDFGNASNISKDTIPIATTACVYKERGNPPQELRDVTGRLSLEKSLYPLVFNDEVIAEMPNGVGSVEEMCEIMSRPIEWAPGLPLGADGFECEYYRKD